MHPPREPNPVMKFMITLALVPSTLLAYNTSPSTTFFNQALAVAFWGAVAWRMGLTAAPYPSRKPAAALKTLPTIAALGLVGLCAALTWGAGAQTASLVAGAAGVCAAGVALLRGGQLAGAGSFALTAGHALFLGWMLTGLLSSAVALVQVFAADWPDGLWIAHSSIPGRAVGNLRQPNHLSSVMLLAAIAFVGWSELQASRLSPDLAYGVQEPARQLPAWHPPVAWLCMGLFIWSVVLTASRTGLLGVALLAIWGLADRRLSRGSRLLLLATPLMYAAAWWGMAWWAQASDHTFGGQQRLAEGDISGSRFRIWADALQLIAAHPWTGVGWGNFNFAWSLTPFPNRHTAFFDHTHNLPLQLAVELGVPMALLICGLLLWGLRQAWQRALAAEPEASAAGRCAVMMIVLIGLHSLLEYPLWYAYFLLPTAFVWGFALGLPPAPVGLATGQPASARAHGGRDDAAVNTGASDTTMPAGTQNTTTPRPAARSEGSEAQPEGVCERPVRLRSWPLAIAGALCVAGAVFSVFDYLRVAEIFAARPGAAPLEQRIEAGKRSVFFAHHAHYAAATVSDTPGHEMAAFDIASHHLLDTRLMMAWAKGLAEVGDLDRARHLAERLREFRNPASAEFFAACDKARSEGLPAAAWPFQCAPPSRALTWQDFLPERRSAQSVPEGR